MIARDLAFGCRLFIKAPLFTIVVIATLALAIGANAAVFSIVAGFILRPLPYVQANKLVFVTVTMADGTYGPYGPLSLPEFLDFRDANHTMADLGSFSFSSATITESNRSQRIHSAFADDGFFKTLRAMPELGRFFRSSDLRVGSAPTIVISDRLWRARFDRAPNVIGRQVVVDDRPRIIVGVAPANMVLPSAKPTADVVDMFIPIVRSHDNMNRGNQFLTVVARLKPETSIAQAQADFGSILKRLIATYGSNKDSPENSSRVTITPMRDRLFGDLRPVAVVLSIAVLAVLVIGCVNVANLLLAHSSGRSRELAVRLSLGASRTRIVAQLLTEVLALAIVGGALGLGLAFAAISGFVALRPPGIPRFAVLDIDWQVLAFTAAVVVVTTIAVGLIPALAASDTRIAPALKEGGRADTGSRGDTLRHVLVVAQVAFAFALVAASGLALRSFGNMIKAPLGFDTSHVMFADTTLSKRRFSTPAAIERYAQQVIEVVRGVPGVQSCAIASWVPLTTSLISTSINFGGRHAGSAPQTEPSADQDDVTTDYFRTLGIPTLAGRTFRDSDDLGRQSVMIVSRSFAARFFPGTHALGKQATPEASISDASPPPRTIVGIVSDVRARSLTDPGVATFYLPAYQFPDSDFTLVIRSALPPAVIGPDIDRAWRSIDAEHAPVDIVAATSLVSDHAARMRITAALLATLAGLALGLATAGLYSMLSFTVARRTRDIGVRMALGAMPGRILRQVMARGMQAAVLGIAIGLVAAVVVGGAMQAVLYDVPAHDPATLTCVALILLAAAALAAYIPAHRATHIEPMAALRFE